MNTQKGSKEEEERSQSASKNSESKGCITTFNAKYVSHCHKLMRSRTLSPSKVHSLETKVKVSFAMAKEVLVNYKREVSISSTNSICSEKSSSSSSSSSASATSYQGVLQCTWKDGLPLHVFSVDGMNEVYVAKVGPSSDHLFDYVYTFHCGDLELDNVGMMRVSSFITFLSDNSQMRETQFVMSQKNRFTNDVLGEKDYVKNIELAAIIAKEIHGDDEEQSEVGGWGLKFLKKLRKDASQEIRECSSSLDVVIPAGVHGGPKTGVEGISSLVERWIAGGHCDCGGWDIACPLTVLNMRMNLPDSSERCHSIDLFVQGLKQDKPTLRMVDIHEGLYYIHFMENLSTLQSFAIAVAIIHSCSRLLRLKMYKN